MTKNFDLSINFLIFDTHPKLQNYSKVSNKRTVFDNRTGGDISLQKV